MFGLSIPETILFACVVAVYIAAAIAGVLQLSGRGEKYRHFPAPLVSLAVVLEAVILIIRTVAIRAVPLTGLFESMIVLTIVFGILYLFFNIAVRQVWFGSIMVWVILAMVLMAGAVAKPAAQPAAAAATPWAIAHGVAMILGGAAVAFATASALLYLLGRRRLKQKKVMQVLDRVPNIEKLERMNLFGIRAGFVLITFGLISGLGLAWVRYAMLKIGILDWLTDAKVLSIIASWILLGIVLILDSLSLLKGKARAHVTIATFVLVLFAILGVTILDATRHDFASPQKQVVPPAGAVKR